MKVLCAVVGHQLATLEAGDVLGLRLEDHVASCLRCQAVKVRDRRLRRALAGLATQTITAPPGLRAAVEAMARSVGTRPYTVAPAGGALEAPRQLWPGRIGSPGALVGVAAVAAGGAALAAWRMGKRPA